MKNLKALIIAFSIVTGFSSLGFTKTLVLEADLPDQYVGTNNNSYVHGVIIIDQSNGTVKGIEIEKSKMDQAKASADQVIELKTNGEWNVVYPGLIDLHNHTKQNNLGVWQHAHGQFANRFEWRAWNNYKKSVSNNMNPWIGYGKAVTCAAFRWSELQAMVVGTTYLQGPSSCVENFAIHQVESSNAFPLSKKLKVQAPTDLVIPADMVFVWQTLKPIMDSENKTYEEALAQVINEYCDSSVLGMPFTAEDVSTDEGLAILKDQAKLKAACTKKVPLDQLPKKFIRYIYWVHKTIASRKKYVAEIAKGNGSAVIAHLAEGRNDDAYNQKEYELVKIFGLNQPHVNFVHAVGLTDSHLDDMAKNDMGIIWSPFSNMLLYNETLQVDKAIKKGILIAMGSDWLPTGSKGPLEELKIAYDYIEAQGLENALAKMDGADSAEEALFKMVTENPAKMINHWQDGADRSKWQNGESKGGVGTIAEGAMASLIVTTKIDKNNPYKNIVRHVWETDINLVLVDGKIQYGNESFLKVAGLEYDLISENDEHGMGPLQKDSGAPVLFARSPKPNKEEKFDFLGELSEYIIGKADAGKISGKVSCQFEDQKGFVVQNTIHDDEELVAFEKSSGMNLDRFKDIQRLLGAGMTTQSRNRNDKEKGDPDFVVEEFTPLYTCNDEYHTNRITDFISKTWPEDRKNRPKELSTKPARMAEDYK